MKIPLTILHNDPQINTRKILHRHIPLMYEDGLRQLDCVIKGTIEFTLSYSEFSVEMERWVCSEKYLYNLVEALGQRIGIFTHEQFEESVNCDEVKDNTAPPGWLKNTHVRNRYVAELMYCDNIDRLQVRWELKELESAVPRYGISAQRRGISSLEYALTRIINDFGGMSPATLTTDIIKRCIQYYALYEISGNAFLGRNRYHSSEFDYLIYEKKPYIQRVATPKQIRNFLIARYNRMFGSTDDSGLVEIGPPQPTSDNPCQEISISERTDEVPGPIDTPFERRIGTSIEDFPWNDRELEIMGRILSGESNEDE